MSIRGIGAPVGHPDFPYPPQYYQPQERLSDRLGEIIRQIEKLNGGKDSPKAKEEVEKFKEALNVYDQGSRDAIEEARLVRSVHDQVKPQVQEYADNVPLIYEARAKMDTADSSTEDYLRLLKDVGKECLSKLAPKYRKVLADDIKEKEEIWKKHHKK